MMASAARCGRSLTVWQSATTTTWNPSATAERMLVSNEEDAAAALPHALGQAVDALDHSGQVVLRIAAKQTLLHVDHEENVERGRHRQAAASLSPTMPATMSATLMSRAALADSPRSTMPSSTVPT